MDISDHLAKKWTTPIAIPNLQTLRSYFCQKLKDDEKIPVSQEEFDAMCTPYTPLAAELALSGEQLSALFRVSEDERAPNLTEAIRHAMNSPPPRNGTEDRYHFTYDLNISKIVEAILPDGEAGRYSNRNTSTKLKRPDYSFLIHNRCIFRGEEKGMLTAGNPARELLDKLTKHWPYNPLTWVLGLSSFYYRMTKLSSLCHRLLRRNYKDLLCCNSERSFTAFPSLSSRSHVEEGQSCKPSACASVMRSFAMDGFTARA